LLCCTNRRYCSQERCCFCSYNLVPE
jgi:hypothetical protein